MLIRKNMNLGKEGEEAIVHLIKKKGWSILETNWHSRFGEIDIIAQDSNNLVFIEVKTRSGDAFGSPLDAVNHFKLHKMYVTAEKYLLSKNWDTMPYRFDVFAVIKKGGTLHIEHYPNIEIL